MRTEAYIAKPKRLWRSVVLKIPHPTNGARQRLKRAVARICRELKINPKRARVRHHSLQRAYFAYIPIYEGEGTREERKLFKRGMTLARQI